MRWPAFQTEQPGKWVLAGEHSVLRGGTALALPHPELKLTLSFTPNERGELEVRSQAAASVVLEMLQALGDPMPSGLLEIESTIPLGAGLGSSAALCVAMTSWLAQPRGIARAEWQRFAAGLEDWFHGRSSGMDVAVIIAGQPIAYSAAEGARLLGLKNLPRFTFHDTGLRASTSDCIRQVETFRTRHPGAASHADARMNQASQDARAGLHGYDSGKTSEGLTQLAAAMTAAQACFADWGLMPPAADTLREDLLRRGARAVKLTGAGGGGMLVALWGASQQD